MIFMPSIEFDSFLSTLYSAVNSTQKTIDQRQEGVLRRLIEGSETGEAEAVTWMFSVPVVGDNGVTHYSMELPLLSLRSHQSVRISEVSIEFNSGMGELSGNEKKRLLAISDREVDEDEIVAAQRKASTLTRLVLTLKKWREKLSPRSLRIQVTLKGKNTLEGEVTVNGELLKKFNS
jgi:hypothetical protein